jgi:hypothetical protein
MSAQMAIFVVVVIAVVGWFALGTHINVRKGHRFLEWLQAGLPLMGGKTTLRWLGSSVVQLQIADACEPFRSVEVLIVLEPRDVPPLWLLSRLRGRRDLLIVRTQLRDPPKSQLEILHTGAWSTQSVEREVKNLNWQLMEILPFRVYALQLGAEPSHLIATAEQTKLELLRLGVRRSGHALEVHWRLPSQPLTSSRDLFQAAHILAAQV